MQSNQDYMGRSIQPDPLSIKLKKYFYKSFWASKHPGERLIKAAIDGEYNLMKYFVDRAKELDANLDDGSGGFKEFMEQRDSSGDTALHKAVAKGHKAIIRLLVQAHQGLVSVENRRGKTPLSMLRKSAGSEKAMFEVLTSITWTMNGQAHEAVIPIDDQHELVNYTESIMDQAPHDIQIMESSLNKNELRLSLNRNNILHFLTENGDADHVSDLVKRHPSLLYLRNVYGETPAYIAAREGHFQIADMFINHLTSYKYHKNGVEETIEELMTRSTDKDTALHVAIHNNHTVVFILLMARVSRLASHINDNKESLLYLAAEKGYNAIMKEIMDKVDEPTFTGPKGKTALHAAVLSGSSACVNHLPDHLLNVRDGDDRTALYYATHLGHSSVVEALLRKDCSIGCRIMDKDDLNFTTHHIAASRGHCSTLEVLLSKCPRCPEITNNKRRNILHVAVEEQKQAVIEFILKQKTLGSLINQKDVDGNTPLHLLAASNFEMGALIKDPRTDFNALNKDGKTPLDMASTDDRRHKMLQAMSVDARRKPVSKKEGLKEDDPYFKLLDNTIIVDTLIATASFAAAFTVPGGFDGNEGTKQGQPFLLKKASFRAFVVTNALAFAFSSLSILSYFNVLGGRYKVFIDAKQIDIERMVERMGRIRCLTLFAMVAMMIAFVTGLYASVEHSKDIAAPACCLCVFILFFLPNRSEFTF